MSEWNGVLIIAEARGSGVHPVTYELLGKGRELADALSCELSCLLLCAEADCPEESNFRGADRVYLMRSNAFAYPEEYLYKANIVEFIKRHRPGIVLAGATAFGRSLAPRVAAALGTGLTADCTGLEPGEGGRLVQIRPAFSDNILAHITSRVYPQMATVRPGEFSASARDTEREVNVVNIPAYINSYEGTVITELIGRNTRDITQADVIVACGRGIKAAEDIALIRQLADCLGGQVGFSRALVDAGLADAANQIGYSGLRVKPRLYIACGISGAPQHLAGMKGSGTVIAINRDASAPIFGVCDIGYVGDLYQVIPRMIKELGAVS
ncbi:MAG: electron transfer flavoprotein subunit alpha/FixB family protein [Defluviitaleaceae bacterium]|nr:electron transfer flavoprotein subunit alpha/FixB family protein [Defluviitaleaceae bacterium]